ncbi:hypothetical protein, partial [Erwinia sp. B116]|uniref:hypothetical protein n=1 Tax=Erwinia sp. B116 TaxID=1561024 RepID=UPI001E47C105
MEAKQVTDAVINTTKVSVITTETEISGFSGGQSPEIPIGSYRFWGSLRHFLYHTHKKAPCFRMRLVCLFDAWQFPTLAWGGPTLPSALRRFT